MQDESEKIFEQLRESMDSLGHLKDRVVSQVNASSRRLKLDEEIMDHKVGKMVELEKYQEKEALERVKGDMKHAENDMGKLHEWRNSAEDNANKWRNFVTGQFD